ncbi:coniferyl aldehyde dehydrogenase [Paraburkholderia silviterrae]|uniref:Aldehyde dehydrogenase n=1 Tax=Paraburkholderia silviterrae TaxID=2528715 RepID=A0A4R5M401_9BURK|nr:coniferyl aldehyde dehydrogenase [Paraburkholderia silviterrae]TDG20037.1 coniferyl aldehyde dehydrogenase [Paraburkholderia silviterrae]
MPNKFKLPIEPSGAQIRAHLDAMKATQIKEGPPSAALRKDRLDRAIDLLRSHKDALADAINTDYSCRGKQQTLLADILASIEGLKFNREHLDAWMSQPATIEPFPGVKTRVEYQPLGVVGIISPWNFPIVLAFGPLAGAFAAGNRAILKPSELTPNTSALMAELIAQYFNSDELTTVLGGPETGAAFSAQPFDHLVFTGSTQVAHHVMRAASENLVPVTLELGGKSPVLVSPHADLQRVAERVLTVKTFNAGQICLSPDYVLIPADRVRAFVAHAEAAVAQMYPTMRENPDYTAMIDVRGFERQLALVEDASQKGASTVSLAPHHEDLNDPAVRKMAPTIITGATDTMRVMQEEIFGPVLPVVTYETLDDALAFINSRPRPLALYYFGDDPAEQQRVARRTTSGALVVNDAMTHVFFDSLPFGGVGASGMGHYHGEYGYRTFSHAKPVVFQSAGGESNLLMRAPYLAQTQDAVNGMIAA